MKAIFERKELLARNVYAFWFKPEKPVRYVAGQFTEMHLPHDNPDDRGQKRWFTLSSSPTDKLISITTRFADGRSSTFKKQLRALKPGTELNLADPMGDFVLPKDARIPLVFVAGGMGITPIHSILKYLHDTGEKRQIQLIYIAEHLDQMPYHDLYLNYDVDYVPIPKHAPSSWKGRTGAVTVTDILELAGNKDEKLFYVSGPEPLAEAFTKELEQRGVDKHRVVTDYFPGYKSF